MFVFHCCGEALEAKHALIEATPKPDLFVLKDVNVQVIEERCLFVSETRHSKHPCDSVTRTRRRNFPASLGANPPRDQLESEASSSELTAA